MKLKQGYVLREVANTWVVLSLFGVDMNGMLKLNSSGALLWRAMEQGSDFNELVKVLTSDYEVTKEQAEVDVKKFLNRLHQFGCIED